jgi:hypothetical protein
VTELLALRTQMGRLAGAEQHNEQGAHSASSAFVVAAPIELPSSPATLTRPDAPQAISADEAAVQASTQSVATTPWVAPEAVTDTTSVTQPEVAQPTLARKTPSIAKYASVGVGLALLAVAALVVSRHVSQPDAAAPVASATVQSAKPMAESNPSSSPSLGGQGPDSAVAPDNAYIVVLIANAPVRSLRIDGRALAVASPWRTLEVPLTSAESNRECRVDVTSVDGRTAAGTIAAGARSLVLQFATQPTGAWGPPPLATNPYAKGK